MKKKAMHHITALCILIFAFGLIFFQNDTSESVKSALKLCINSVIPSLFPFFIVSNLIINLDFFDVLKKRLKHITLPLFSLNSNALSPLFLGIIGGYPIGASACASIYKAKLITKQEAERLLAFCNNCSPAFIIGAVGYGIFRNANAGILLFIIHISASFTTGILFRLFRPVKSHIQLPSFDTKGALKSFSFAFTDSVFSAIKSSLSVCAYVSLFSVIIQLLKSLYILPGLSIAISEAILSDATFAEAFLSGILEFTSGINALSSSSNFKTAFISSAFLLGWGGLSVHAQTLSCISGCDLCTKQYFLGKFLHGVISAIYAFPVTFLLGNESVYTFSASSYTPGVSYTYNVFFILLLPLIYFFCKKGWKKAK